MDRKCNPEAGSSKPPLLLYQSESGAREHFFSPCPPLGRPALGPQASQHMVSVKSAKSRLRKDVSRQGFGSSVRALAGNVVTFCAHNLQHGRLWRTLLQRSSRLQTRCDDYWTDSLYCSGSP